MDGQIYWDESVYYRFTKEEIDELEDTSSELQRLSLLVVEYVIRFNLFDELCIPEKFIPLIIK